MSLTSGVSSALNPAFNIWEAVEPYAATLLREERGNVVQAVTRQAVDTAGLLARLPRRIDKLATRMEEAILEDDAEAEHLRLVEMQERMLQDLRLAYRVIDVAAGEEIPRKGGPAITKSDLLIINKTDLAPHVGASLEVMERDATRMRAGRPFEFVALRHGDGVEAVIGHILSMGGLAVPA